MGDRLSADNSDIVNIGWHIYLKDITAYAASPRDWYGVVAFK